MIHLRLYLLKVPKLECQALRKLILIYPTLLRSSPLKPKQPVVSPELKSTANDDFMRKRFKKDDNDDVEIIRPAKQVLQIYIMSLCRISVTCIICIMKGFGNGSKFKDQGLAKNK